MNNKYSIIQKSQLEGAHRLDAEYFQPEYLSIERDLNSIETKQIGEITNSVVNFGAYSLCNYIKWANEGVPYLNVENIKEGYVDYEGVKLIDKKVNEILKKSKVKEGQVILTMAGTIGNAAVARNVPRDINSNQATAKITLKSGWSPYYITAFLNSHYGKKQTEREIVSSVQPNIFLGQIKKFKVPAISLGDQKRIEEIFIQGLVMLEKSKSLYSQAENILLEELGLKEFKGINALAYIVKHSEVRSAHRIDADYFQPKYEIIVSKMIAEHNAEKVKDIEYIKVTTGQYCEEYVAKEDGKPYIRGTDLSMGTVKEDDLYYIDPKRQDEARKAKEGDVVVTRVGSIGVSARLPKAVEGGTISDNLIRMRFPEAKLDSYYVGLYFNTIGSQLMIRESRGSVQARLNQETLKEIVLPILPKSTQQKIADMVRRSHEARKKAKELLEEAKRKVEEMIEVAAKK